MARNIEQFRERWRPVEGSNLANLFAEFEEHQAEKERLSELREQRLSELSVVQGRLESIQPDADPQLVVDDRLLVPVLSELAERLQLAAQSAASEVDRVHAQIASVQRGLNKLETALGADEAGSRAQQQHDEGMDYWCRLPADEAPERYAFPQQPAWWLR